MACGTCKYQESPVRELPGCDVYSIRQRPRNFPKNDINYADWNVVMWNIEKKSRRCQLTATGDTREEAIATMQEMLIKAEKARIDTYNGIPGSGLGGNKTATPDQIITEYRISPDSFTNIKIKIGPWRPKKKGGKNNNCGRNDTHQQMRKILLMVEYEQVERVKE